MIFMKIIKIFNIMFKLSMQYKDITARKLPGSKSSLICIGIIMILNLIPTCIFAQKADWQPKLREIIVNYKDSVVKAHVLLQKAEIDVSDKLVYYWYGQNNINLNMGGYSGQLLQGEYAVFNNNNCLIVKGNFEKGLKHGEWKTWYATGILKTTTIYHQGIPDSEMIIYDATGNILETRRYKNGKLEIKEEDKPKKSFRLRLKKQSQKDTVPTDTLAVPIENMNIR